MPLAPSRVRRDERGVAQIGELGLKIDFARSGAGLAVGFAGLLWLVAFGGYAAPGVAAGNYGHRHLIYLAGTAFLGAALSIAFAGAVVGSRRLATPLRLALGAALVAAISLVHSALDLLAIRLYLRELYQVGPNALVSGEGIMFLNNMLMLTPTHVTYAIGLSLGLALKGIAEREHRLAAALSAAQQAQIAALRFQINPHFLFNSLNAVISLIGAGREREAQTVVSRLAEFFRATLSTEPDALVPLEEEFDHLGAYLDIEGARFGERLRVDVHLPQELCGALTPHLLLQPLVENAIKHAVAPSKRPVTITISAGQEPGRLVLTVSDTGAGDGAPRQAGTRVGLANVEARLAALYGDRGDLTVKWTEAGFRAVARLPLEIV
ncbi:MAG: sensor histidine kinase [Pseudomonadota bacterium]